MYPVKWALREAFFPDLFGGEEVDNAMREILGTSLNAVDLGY